MGSEWLYGVQYGKETTHGTNVAADTILYCRASLPDSDREIHQPRANIGRRTAKLSKLAHTRRVLVDGMTLEDADGAYFGLMPLLLSLCLKGGITSTEQNTSQGDYLWTFSSPQTGAETLDSMTLEVFDDTQAYEVGYCMARSLRFTWDCVSGEAHVSANLFGKELIQTTKTSLTTFPAGELLNGKLTQVYVDATYASLGSSELAATLVSAELEIMGGATPKPYGSNARTFSAHGQNEIDATLRLTVDRNSSVATEELKYRPASGYSPTMRAVRIVTTGSQIGTGDSRKLQIDAIGEWTGWRPIAGSVDGNNYDEAVLSISFDDTTGSNPLEVNVITTVQTI